ncbi:MAG: hypothetical protein ABIH39_08195 [Candidatus Margulisiibacteriota bacterium]
MIFIYSITGVLLLCSIIADYNKTWSALKIGWCSFAKIILPIMQMLILVSIVLFFVPATIISTYLGQNNGLWGVVIGCLLGSIALMPGFIAYPLSGILLKQGVSHMAIAAFVTTLMMVGILTYPLEKAYFGTKITIIRNCLSFVVAIIIALAIGLLYGEIL